MIVTASPYLTDSYNFRTYDLIVFKIRLVYDGSTGLNYTNIRMNIESQSIDLAKGAIAKDQFTDAQLEGSTVTFTSDVLIQNAVLIGNISGIVKPNIEPFRLLELKITLNATQGDNYVINYESKSFPTLLGGFSDVNVAGVPEGSID